MKNNLNRDRLFVKALPENYEVDLTQTPISKDDFMKLIKLSANKPTAKVKQGKKADK